MNRAEYMKEWKRNNRVKTRSYFQRWYENKGKEHRRKYYIKNREKALAYQAKKRGKTRNDNPRAYARRGSITPEERLARKRESNRKWSNKHREHRTPEEKQKEKARKDVGHALRSGKLKRLPCEVCGLEKAEAHHPDYSKPLEIKWLCKTHHVLLHRKK